MTADEALDRLIHEKVREHSLAVEGLTEGQFVEALRQAIACGDFKRYAMVQGGLESAQAVTYIPFAEAERLKRKINELEEALAETEARLAEAAMTPYERRTNDKWNGR